jgi:hypothetical protein
MISCGRVDPLGVKPAAIAQDAHRASEHHPRLVGRKCCLSTPVTTGSWHHRAMALLGPVGRTRAIELVSDGEIPLPLGYPQPKVMVVEQEGAFRIRELVTDPAAVQAAATVSTRARSPSWVPSHYFSLGAPIGEIFAEASSRDELIAAMLTMPWPEDW